MKCVLAPSVTEMIKVIKKRRGKKHTGGDERRGKFPLNLFSEETITA